MKVQLTLGRLNWGQNVIFSIGLTINLLLAANDVTAGVLTPGDFVMIQAFFMQMAAPLNFMGTFFREVQQSQVDIEDLYLIMKQDPLVKEKQDAVPYQFKEGRI